MKVKIIDEGHESDLEKEVNIFIKENDIEVIDIKLSTSCSVYSEEQIYCFTAMIIYKECVKEWFFSLYKIKIMLWY